MLPYILCSVFMNLTLMEENLQYQRGQANTGIPEQVWRLKSAGLNSNASCFISSLQDFEQGALPNT